MLWLIALLLTVSSLVYHRLGLGKGSIILLAFLAIYSINNYHPIFALGCLLFLGAINVGKIRQQLFSKWLFNQLAKAAPKISPTEQEALEAGDVWWDGQLFSGQPDWQILHDLPASKLSPQEQKFINGEVEILCEMLDDWQITHQLHDLPATVWDYIKQHKFCGIIIPKKYGGLEFSHYAHSQIVLKIASRSASAAVTVMVPNSLGPAKLLLSYGTDAQKSYYLPRLANGVEIPCFALTGPNAGSDASAIPDTGIVCRDIYEGKEVLGVRLNWHKRYITLGPVATIIGLAFKMFDPEHLISDEKNIGITIALIPANTSGVSIGKRHFPLNGAFQNGPNWGKDVFVPLTYILGGAGQAGKGWKMLMQSLATGRAISLPALSAGAAKLVCRNSGAYCRIRQQFNVAIGEFEGIQTQLAMIAGETYLINAARTVTAAALESGVQPAVVSAIIKYELTERMRRVVNAGMDIQGGSGICLGPRNYIGRLYQVLPVCITVEGANILTRSLMIFGQGAVRCHPYIYQQMQNLHGDDHRLALAKFDELLLAHLGFMGGNKVRALWLGLGATKWQPTPGGQATRPYYRAISRLSAGFAFAADCAIVLLGGSLKRKERVSGLFADVVSNLYLASAALKHFHDQKCPDADLPLLHWACQHSIYQAQEALWSACKLLPWRLLSFSITRTIFPYGKTYQPPADHLNRQLADILQTESEARDRLTEGIYTNRRQSDPTGRIEVAFTAVLKAAAAEQKIRTAQRQGKLAKGVIDNALLQKAVASKIITDQQSHDINQAQKFRTAAIEVDDFATL